MKDWATTEKKIVTSSIATNHISVRQCLHFGLTNEIACQLTTFSVCFSYVMKYLFAVKKCENYSNFSV